MKGLDIPALRMFAAAVEGKSLTSAADRENVVISAVSKRIAELEGYLGKALLVRRGRGVEPTAAGTLFYQRTKAILRSIQLAEDAICGFGTDGQAMIHLAANPSTILQFLPAQMGRYFNRRPNVRVDLIECHSYDIPRHVADGTVDLGIYHSRDVAPGVVSYPYCQDRVGLVVPNNHPLAGQRSLFFEEALDYDLLGYFPRHSLEQFLAYVGLSVTRPPNVRLQVANFEARCRMVMEGLGVALVPESIAQGYLSRMGLVMLRVRDEWAVRQFFLCIRDTSDARTGVVDLLHFLLENAPGNSL